MLRALLKLLGARRGAGPTAVDRSRRAGSRLPRGVGASRGTAQPAGRPGASAADGACDAAMPPASEAIAAAAVRSVRLTWPPFRSTTAARRDNARPRAIPYASIGVHHSGVTLSKGGEGADPAPGPWRLGESGMTGPNRIDGVRRQGCSPFPAAGACPWRRLGRRLARPDNPPWRRVPRAGPPIPPPRTRPRRPHTVRRTSERVLRTITTTSSLATPERRDSVRLGHASLVPANSSECPQRKASSR